MTYERKEREGLCNYHTKNLMLNVPMVFLLRIHCQHQCHPSISINLHYHHTLWLIEHLQHASTDSFTLKTGRTSVCSGYCNHFTQLDDLVMRHAKYRTFARLPTSKYGNTYYHARQCCFGLKWEESFNRTI